jgi:hypothetical protein
VAAPSRLRQSAVTSPEESPSRVKAFAVSAFPNSIKRPPASHQRNAAGACTTELPHGGSTVSIPVRKARNACEPSAAAVEDQISVIHDGMEQLLKSVDIVVPASGIIPKPLNRSELTDTDLDVGSVVEFDIDTQTHYGVIRWIGFLTDKACAIAGIELVCQICFTFNLQNFPCFL